MCVSESELKLIKMNINSLRFYSGNHITNYKISVPPNRTDVIDICKQLDVQVLNHSMYFQKYFGKNSDDPAFDTSNRIHELIKSCTSDWVLLSHLDVVWKEPIITDMTDRVGMVGIWPHGSTLINREVYERCHHGFWPLGCLWAVELDGQRGIRVVGRCDQKYSKCIINALDVGMMLTLEMQYYGYDIIMELYKCYHHLGGISTGPQKSHSRNQWAINEFKQFI